MGMVGELFTISDILIQSLTDLDANSVSRSERPTKAGGRQFKATGSENRS